MQLHQAGYLSDFCISDRNQLSCLQDGRQICPAGASIKLIDQCYDQFSQTFKYIHTVDTACGSRGLLVAEAIFTNLPFKRATNFGGAVNQIMQIRSTDAVPEPVSLL
jgi:hypothetical protein